MCSLLAFEAIIITPWIIPFLSFDSFSRWLREFEEVYFIHSAPHSPRVHICCSYLHKIGCIRETSEFGDLWFDQVLSYIMLIRISTEIASDIPMWECVRACVDSSSFIFIGPFHWRVLSHVYSCFTRQTFALNSEYEFTWENITRSGDKLERKKIVMLRMFFFFCFMCYRDDDNDDYFDLTWRLIWVNSNDIRIIICTFLGIYRLVGNSKNIRWHRARNANIEQALPSLLFRTQFERMNFLWKKISLFSLLHFAISYKTARHDCVLKVCCLRSLRKSVRFVNAFCLHKVFPSRFFLFDFELSVDSSLAIYE